MTDDDGNAATVPGRPGRPRRAEQRDTREIVVRCATALFAERGFEAVGVRDVARAAGVNVATVHHHTGRKADLYEACFARIFDAESAAMTAALAPAAAALDDGAEALLEALHAVVDTFAEFLEAHPETTALWLRRWLAPQAQNDLSRQFAHPLYAQVEDVLARAHERGLLHEPTPHVAVRSLVWAVHGHVVELGVSDDPAARLRDLRSFLHRWLDALYPRGAH